jgi:hypothetical protein
MKRIMGEVMDCNDNSQRRSIGSLQSTIFLMVSPVEPRTLNLQRHEPFPLCCYRNIDPLLVIILQADGRIALADPAVFEMTRIAAQEAIGIDRIDEGDIVPAVRGGNVDAVRPVLDDGLVASIGTDQLQLAAGGRPCSEDNLYFLSFLRPGISRRQYPAAHSGHRL